MMKKHEMGKIDYMERFLSQGNSIKKFSKERYSKKHGSRKMKGNVSKEQETRGKRDAVIYSIIWKTS